MTVHKAQAATVKQGVLHAVVSVREKSLKASPPTIISIILGGILKPGLEKRL
jgi:hypothetical protein